MNISKEKFFDLSTEMLVILDPKGKFREMNPPFRKFLGISKKELEIKRVNDFLHPEDSRAALKILTQISENRKKTSFESRLKSARGIYISLTWIAYYDKKSGAIYTIMKKISQGKDSVGELKYSLKEAEKEIAKKGRELEKANKKLEIMSITDGLTQVRNRRAFMSFLDYSIKITKRENENLSLVILDVDNFKEYNEKFGHQEGDNILKQFAKALEKECRHSDYIARYGGAEFSIILQKTDKSGAIKIGKKLLMALKNAKWKNRPVTASFGIATMLIQHLPDRKDIDYSYYLISQADDALSHSKETGGNRVTHWDDLE